MANFFYMNMKSLFATLMCGLSTFTIFPQTDYSKGTHEDAASIMKESWAKTGGTLWNTIGRLEKSPTKSKYRNK